MQCISPVKLPCKPSDPEFPHKVFVYRPCGKCYACRANLRRDWFFRLRSHAYNSVSSLFVTLTYDEQHLPRSDCGWPTTVKRDLQLFFKRLRKKLQSYEKEKGNKPKISYYAINDYGGEFERPHYHVLLFGLPVPLESILKEIWPLGSIDTQPITAQRINYVLAYHIRKCERAREDLQTTGMEDYYALISNHIGESLAADRWSSALRSGPVPGTCLLDGRGTVPYRIPRYVLDKGFTRQEIDKIKEAKLKYHETILEEILEKTGSGDWLSAREALRQLERQRREQIVAKAMRIKNEHAIRTFKNNLIKFSKNEYIQQIARRTAEAFDALHASDCPVHW